MTAKRKPDSGRKPKPGSSDGGKSAAAKRAEEDRRTGSERRDLAEVEARADDPRLADRRTGLDRRRDHLHYDDLTKHPRPDRNINDYPLSTDEVEFINAVNDYKAKFSRPFPTWSEVLHVLRTLGYVRADGTLIPPGEAPEPPSDG